MSTTNQQDGSTNPEGLPDYKQAGMRDALESCITAMYDCHYGGTKEYGIISQSYLMATIRKAEEALKP